jgi:hypothetical protein
MCEREKLRDLLTPVSTFFHSSTPLLVSSLSLSLLIAHLASPWSVATHENMWGLEDWKISFGLSPVHRIGKCLICIEDLKLGIVKFMYRAIRYISQFINDLLMICGVPLYRYK